MSAKTPLKNENNTESKLFSPVILSKSPAAASPQKNLTGLPRVARDIAADVYNNIQKWNDQHIKGVQVLKEIASIKASAEDMFPQGLDTCLSELYDVVQNLSIYSNALIFLTSQMRSLSKLHQFTSPLFISMTVGQISKIIEEISEAYRDEFRVKEYVLENVAYSRDKDEAMFHAACWAHQQYITNDINLKLQALLLETGHRQIT